MTLPDPTVFEMLADDFVVGWKNIEREEWCGTSAGYAPTQSAVGTTNGAGAHNVQIFVLAPDRTVLHVLPGFWHPEDFARELRFALALDRLWEDDSKSLAEKRRMYQLMHRAEVALASDETIARSDWQPFDRQAEIARLRGEDRDTVADVEGKHVELEPLNVLVHERMALRPFVPFDRFDTAAFVDYGREHYDNNQGDRGQPFSVLERMRAKRAYEAERERKKQEWLAKHHRAAS